MVDFWQGNNTTLSASGSGTIRIRVSVDGEITQFLVNSTGRVQITDIEVMGYEDIFDGTFELEQFKKDGNTYDLPETIPVTRGTDVVISVTDISGASNDVYFGLHITKK